MVFNMCLNPCFWGRCADSVKWLDSISKNRYGLNPCFGGRYMDKGNYIKEYITIY